MLRIIRECVILLAVTVVVGLVWNAASGKGLTLTRDYFQRLKVVPPVTEVAKTTPDAPKPTTQTQTPKPVTTEPASPDNGTGASSDPATTEPGADDPNADDPNADDPNQEEPEECPQYKQGVQAMCLEDAMLWAEPDMADLAAFIDARTKDNYEEAHIPGAYSLYTYQAEKLIDAIKADLELKQYLIVYCGGGDCEDSISLASMMINEFGFSYESVYVYLGGLEEWQAAGNPVVTGGNRE